MYTHNGTPLPEHRSFELNDVQYPANWLQLASPANLLAAGITYTPDPAPSLNSVKARKIRDLKESRNTALDSTVVVGTRTWPTDEAFKVRIARIIARIGRGKPAPAKLTPLIGNPINTPTLAQLENIEDAIIAYEDGVHDTYSAKVDLVNAALDNAAVAAITW